MTSLTTKKVFCGIFFLFLLTGTVFAQTVPEFKAFTVKTPDGVNISAQEWGNPNGLEIVFIHGLLQSKMAWAKQVKSDLAKDFRIITYDVRGHGASDKTLDKSLYDYGTGGERYADELAAVIETAKLKKPVLVGWSYGSGIVTDYVRKYGTGKIAGINYVGSLLVLSDNPAYVGSSKFGSIVGKMRAADLETNIMGVKEFLRLCFQKQPTQEEFETALAYNAMVPTELRTWLSHRYSYEDVVKTIKIPVLLTHGTEDGLVKVDMVKYLAPLIPNSRTSLYQGIGHSTFWEDSLRFNAELASFVREVNGPTK